MHTIKALIFDFDGLILDTETPEVAVWKAIYAEHGFEYPMDQWSQTVGGWGKSTFDPGAALHKLAGSELNLDEVRRRHREESTALILQEPMLPGVMEYLDAARRLGLRLAIASSSERTWVEPHLARLGIKPYFEKIVCGDDILSGHTKPYPDVFLAALSELKIAPEEAVVLEILRTGCGLPKLPASSWWRFPIQPRLNFQWTGRTSPSSPWLTCRLRNYWPACRDEPRCREIPERSCAWVLAAHCRRGLHAGRHIWRERQHNPLGRECHPIAGAAGNPVR